MLTDQLVVTLVLALVAGLGILIVYFSLTDTFRGVFRNTLLPPEVRAQTVVLSDLPPLVQRAFGPLLGDLGRLLLRRGAVGDLENRLRQSGWRYHSLEDYWGSQMAFLVAGVVFGILTWYFLALPLSALVLLPGLFGLGGFLIPRQNVQDAIDKRRKAVFIEMAWTLDRLAAGLRAGRGLEVSIERVLAWSAGGGGGLFAAVLRDISAGLATNALDFERYLSDLRRALPDGLPQLDEFFQICKLNKRGQAVAGHMEQLAATMRDALNNKVTEVSQAAERRIQLIGPGVILLVAVMLGAGLPMFVLLR